MTVEDAEVLWAPDEARIQRAWLTAFTEWLSKRHARPFDSYEALWQWSVDQPDLLWNAVWDFFEVRSEGSRAPVLADRKMPGAQWYPNTRLNYAEHAFARASSTEPALVVCNEVDGATEVSWQDLRRQAGALAHTLRALGVGPGDRVVSCMPNRAETVVAFLACASLGAIWSSCSPDMGTGVVLARFGQIEPKVLFTVDSYSYNGRVHDRSAVMAEIARSLLGLRAVICVGGPAAGTIDCGTLDVLAWDDATAHEAELVFERVPFSHPLWIVYSSGTTGLPKAIVHSHGGIVLTHLKTLGLQHDLQPQDRLLFLGGTGWIVWNLQVGGLLVGATLVLYDGNPAWPDATSVWRLVDTHRVTLFGCGAAYLVQCMKARLRPREFAALQSLRAINSTGSPLPPDAYRWVYDAVKSDVWLASISGGTDIASGFVACAPTLPVVAGELQCRELGVAAYAFDDNGQRVIGETGELVVTHPIPSMPTQFWNDADGTRYRESYFAMYPGIWRHGDWVRFTPGGSAVIYGRSDATINRHGIRMGTAEIYSVVESLPEVADSLLVDMEYLGRPSLLLLFVVPAPGRSLDEALVQRVRQAIREQASARHVPDEVHAIEEVPRTLTGKKMEVPVRKLLLGLTAVDVVDRDTMANPHSLEPFMAHAARLSR
ncbi:acetoacetate--CoA ligase [Variovorax sp. KK3]|uniref:acetoacetate--CoA ligase n=1 Tax=Variovorax sp. KK3 TaxID=1855728 RepID=UPI00097C0C70|nr:acetoacetate--CoA ligase [Variovorax sp. KK3]